MSKPKQPLELAIIKGATKKNPQRYTGDVIRNENALGKPPKHMTKEQIAAWEELEEHALPGVLTASDRFIVEIAASLMAEMRRDPDKFPVGRYSQLKSCLFRLGLSPSDRQNITTPKKPAGNGFSQFLE